jgi:hypothetical protein
MGEFRLSTGALNDAIKAYREMLRNADRVEVDPGGSGERQPLSTTKLDAIVDSLGAASQALAAGCQQTVYGLFLIHDDKQR